jgi:hypothetical protein
VGGKDLGKDRNPLNTTAFGTDMWRQRLLLERGYEKEEAPDSSVSTTCTYR